MSIWQGEGRRIQVNEVGTRDGLQAECGFVPTADKIALIDALSQTGVAKIEVTAFVSPKAIPALSDAREVMRGIARREGVVYTALVPNVRGAVAAIDAGVNEMNLVMSVAETHNLANLRMTREQSFRALEQVVHIARGAHVSTSVSLSCSFGCPMEGNVPETVVLEWAQRHIELLDVRSITLCDTTGMAYPGQVSDLVKKFIGRWPEVELTLHFHNTRGMGLANLLAGIDAGATRFDASLGGIGGCPYAPGATGNLCTEEAVHALQLMGYDTGVDLVPLLAASKQLAALLGHETPGQITKAGRRLDLHSPPSNLAEIRQRAFARDAA